MTEEDTSESSEEYVDPNPPKNNEGCTKDRLPKEDLEDKNTNTLWMYWNTKVVAEEIAEQLEDREKKYNQRFRLN